MFSRVYEQISGRRRAAAATTTQCEAGGEEPPSAMEFPPTSAPPPSMAGVETVQEKMWNKVCLCLFSRLRDIPRHDDKRNSELSRNRTKHVTSITILCCFPATSLLLLFFFYADQVAAPRTAWCHGDHLLFGVGSALLHQARSGPQSAHDAQPRRGAVRHTDRLHRIHGPGAAGLAVGAHVPGQAEKAPAAAAARILIISCSSGEQGVIGRL